MKKPLNTTERAIVKLNHIALTLHHIEFQKRLDRLIARLTGDRQVAEIGEVRTEEVGR